MRFQVGDQPIPGYKLEAFLGAGSYGEVWKAVGPGGVPCALKFISMDSKSGLKEFRSIRLVKRLQHPNLCPVQAIWLRDPDGNVLSDSGEDSISIRLMGPKELVIAMGLGQKSLAQRLEEMRSKGGIPARDLLRYMIDAAKGIDYLNSPEHDLEAGPAPIIHCDIKPANLLIVGGGVQVCDYGVAKALAPDSKKTFAAGTPAYAPPELINNEPCPRTDQYSLAVTYYELRTGRLPFDEARAIVANLMGQLDFSGVGPDEREVLRQATHKQPDKRFESCEEFVEALKLAANITLGPSGVVSVNDTRRQVPAPPPKEIPSARPPTPAAAPAAAKSLSDLLQPGGELVPDHFLTKLLGRGGYGEVWEARASGGVRCALKVVRDLQGRGKQEFEVLDTISKLDHPCLVQLRGYWLLAPNGTRVPANQVGLAGVPDPSIVVISTDLAEKNLLDRLKECKQDGLPGIPPDELVGHVRQAAVALDYLNVKHHIQHRDVKPENLLLRGDRLLVSDFGLAKLVEGDGGAVQSSSSGMTLEYAAPELLQKKVSSRTDQYSLALTYYTLRTGRMPFPSGMGQFDTMQARIKGQLDLSSVSAAEQAVLRKALAPNPADRFGTCEDLARQLAHASGVGTGPVLALRGPDLSRVTPSELAPRMTPLARSGPPAVAKTTPNYPQDTPRASGRPGEVPLTPAEAGGTIMFGDLPPASPGPSSPRATPAPWVADETPVRPTKSGRRAPQWNEDTPAGGGGGGRTAAVIGGVVVLLALAGVGVVVMANRNGTGTVASSSGGTTEPTEKGGNNIGGTVSTRKEPDKRAEKIAVLKAEIARLIGERNFDAAWETVGELKALDEAEASPLAAAVKKAEAAIAAPPPKDDRVTKAAENFRPGQRNIQAGLGALASIPETSTDHPRATALRTAWERAKTAAIYKATDTATLLRFRDEYADLRPPAGSDRLTDTDRDDLRTYYRELLANNIRAAVPGLTDKWAEVAALCDEAAKTQHPDTATRAWVAACRIECRAEQDLPCDDTDATPADPQLGGYAKYVTALRAWQDGTDAPKGLEAAAATAVGLIPVAPPKEAAWASPRRFGRLADLLWAAREPLRTSDVKDLEHPYAEPAAGKAIDWLTAASRAAELAKRPAADRARFDYELLLAKWSLKKPAGDELTRLTDAKYPDALDPAARARFGVILAAARPADAVKYYHVVFDALRSGGGPALRGFTARTVLTRLTTDTGIDRQAGAPELLAAAGRELFRNRRAWADAELADAPTKVAAGLFDRAAVASKRPDDFAWAGICRAEVAGTPYVKLTGDLDAARANGSSPAALVLEGLIAAREPWSKPGAWPDQAAEIAALRKASDLLSKAIAACQADKIGRTDELLFLFDRTAAVTARLADEAAEPKAKDALLKSLDALASDLKATIPGRLEGLRYEARALEGRAPALPTEQKFTPTGAYARADQKYVWAGGLLGTPPGVAVGRGRNLLKWSEDEFRAGGGTFLDRERLDRAEHHLRTVTADGRKDVGSGELAEAHHRLGEAALLRYEAEQSGSEKTKRFGEAMASFQAAAEAAGRPDEDPWTETILRAALNAATALRGRQVDRPLRPADAETTATALDELADRKGPRAPTPIWRAALKVRAVQLREAVRPKAEDWFQRIRDAAEEAVQSGRDREADLRAELLVLLAEGRSARIKHRKHYDPEKAAGFAREAVKLTRTRADLPAALRANAAGALGMALYRGGPEGWAEARTSLEKALAVLPAADSPEGGAGRALPSGWRWRYALGALDLIDAAAASKKEKGVEAADLAVRAMNRLLPMRPPLYQLKGAADADPDDKALAEEFFGTEANVYRACATYWQKVIAAHKDDPRRHTWRLAAAELDWLSDSTPGRVATAKKLAAAVKVCEAALEELGPKSEAADDARRLIERTKSLVPADSP